jgi:hypothetical protein
LYHTRYREEYASANNGDGAEKMKRIIVIMKGKIE